MAQKKTKKASRKADQKGKPSEKPAKKKRFHKLKSECGKSIQEQVRENKLATLVEATAGFDRNQFLVAHEVTPSSLTEKPKKRYRLAWTYDKKHPEKRPVLEKIPIETDQKKPILVPVVWKSTRMTRKAATYGGDTGQLGTFDLETVSGEVKDRYIRLWMPDEKSGYKGLAPSSFTEWSHNGYYQDRIKATLAPVRVGDKVRWKVAPVHCSRWVPRSLERSSDFDQWFSDEVQIDAEWDARHHQAVDGRAVKFIPEHRRDIVERPKERKAVQLKHQERPETERSVMAWNAWGTTDITRWAQERQASVPHNSRYVRQGRLIHQKVEREVTKVARIIIPLTAIHDFVRHCDPGLTQAQTIEKAIKVLDRNNVPVMVDTVTAMCRLRLDGEPNIRWVQMGLKAADYTIQARAFNRGIYGERPLKPEVVSQLVEAGPSE